VTFAKRHVTTSDMLAFTFVAALHAFIFSTILQSHRGPAVSTEIDEPLAVIFIKPQIRDRHDPSLDGNTMANVVLRVRRLPVHLDIEPLDLGVFVERNEAASNVAPSLRSEGQIEVATYTRRAHLSPGQGVTVVLQVEVLESGSPGRVLVDVSGGSRETDEAAVEYAQAQRWYAGRVGGVPRSMWVRWAVHLQA
jgi:TonB family protein